MKKHSFKPHRVAIQLIIFFPKPITLWMSPHCFLISCECDPGRWRLQLETRWGCSQVWPLSLPTKYHDLLLRIVTVTEMSHSVLHRMWRKCGWNHQRQRQSGPAATGGPGMERCPPPLLISEKIPPLLLFKWGHMHRPPPTRSPLTPVFPSFPFSAVSLAASGFGSFLPWCGGDLARGHLGWKPLFPSLIYSSLS